MLQMFLQFEGEHEYHENEKIDKQRGYTKWIEDDKAQHYENYVGTIYYQVSDAAADAVAKDEEDDTDASGEADDADTDQALEGDASNGVVSEELFYSSASCGWEKLDAPELEGRTFMGVEGIISGCGFY